MKKIIVNENNIQYDTLFEKARAIVINEKNNIYVCNMNNTFVLPGGTLERNEISIMTIKRELKEELGIINCEPKELIEINYYHLNFPKYKTELFENRLNRVYYYLLKVNSMDIGLGQFTDYEKLQNIKIEEYSLDELREKIKINNDNKYSRFTNKELHIILEYINEVGV